MPHSCRQRKETRSLAAYVRSRETLPEERVLPWVLSAHREIGESSDDDVIIGYPRHGRSGCGRFPLSPRVLEAQGVLGGGCGQQQLDSAAYRSGESSKINFTPERGEDVQRACEGGGEGRV